MARPPSRGVGTAWTSLSRISASAPMRSASRRVSGVTRKVTAAQITKTSAYSRTPDLLSGPSRGSGEQADGPAGGRRAVGGEARDQSGDGLRHLGGGLLVPHGP